MGGEDELASTSTLSQSLDLSTHAPQSLLTPLPHNRTCAQTGIPKWQCACPALWAEWCPVQPHVVRDTLERILSDLNAELDNYSVLDKPCPVLQLGHGTDAMRCEMQLDEIEEVHENLVKEAGAVKVILRINFAIVAGMEYEVHIEMVLRWFSSHGDIKAEVGRVLDVQPVSPYRQHETCTPIGTDPAFCNCALKK